MYIFYIFVDICGHYCPLAASVNQVLVGMFSLLRFVFFKEKTELLRNMWRCSSSEQISGRWQTVGILLVMSVFNRSPWPDGFCGWILTNNCPDVTNGPPDWPKQSVYPLIPVTLIMEKKWEDISAWVQPSQLGWHTLRTSGVDTIRTCCNQWRTWDQCSEMPIPARN